VPEPKYFAGCAKALNLGLARTLAENRARQEVLKTIDQGGAASSISGRIVDYLDEELVQTCVGDPENEACEFYQQFKALLGDEKLPKGKNEVCALFRTEIVAIAENTPKGSDEKIQPPDVAPAQLSPPKDKSEARSRAQAVWNGAQKKLMSLDSNKQDEAIKFIFQKVEEGYTPEDIINMIEKTF